jgi:hypothetical protein
MAAKGLVQGWFQKYRVSICLCSPNPRSGHGGALADVFQGSPGAGAPRRAWQRLVYIERQTACQMDYMLAYHR